MKVAEYFFVEPEPEPVIEEPKKEEEETSELKEFVTTQVAAKVAAEKVRDQAVTVSRLSAPTRPKQMSK